MANNADGLETLARQIVTTAELMSYSEETCLSKEALEVFLDAWYQLITYYENNDIVVIHVEVVREYLHWLTYLSTIWHDEHLDETCRDQAQEAMEQLEWSLIEIIKAVEMRLYPNGR